MHWKPKCRQIPQTDRLRHRVTPRRCRCRNLSPVQTNLRGRVKNFAAYSREFGMRGAIQIVNNRRSNHKISTVYCPQVWSKLHYRRGTADFGQLRRIIGRLDMPPIHVDRGLIVDAGANVGYTTALFAHWSPIVLWPYPIYPWPGEPLPAEYDLLIYTKNRSLSPPGPRLASVHPSPGNRTK